MTNNYFNGNNRFRITKFKWRCSNNLLKHICISFKEVIQIFHHKYLTSILLQTIWSKINNKWHTWSNFLFYFIFLVKFTVSNKSLDNPYKTKEPPNSNKSIQKWCLRINYHSFLNKIIGKAQKVIFILAVNPFWLEIQLSSKIWNNIWDLHLSIQRTKTNVTHKLHLNANIYLQLKTFGTPLLDVISIQLWVILIQSMMST